jgi:hypothetical protein
MRFLHINSVHDHPAVLNDLNNFVPLLNNQAVIVLGNCFNPELPGVITAMTEFCLSSMGRHIRPFRVLTGEDVLVWKAYGEGLPAPYFSQRIDQEHVVRVGSRRGGSALFLLSA